MNLRQNSASKAGQHVFHFHMHVVPRYDDDTLLPGAVWGLPPWEPPKGGEAEGRRVADAIRRGLAARFETPGWQARRLARVSRIAREELIIIVAAHRQ
jgi:diadenosine tetraphosphate (Ap4A) HIT family hydrolase